MKSLDKWLGERGESTTYYSIGLSNIENNKKTNVKKVETDIDKDYI